MQAEAIYRRILIAMSILAVAYYGVSDALRMHTNLIGTPCFEVQFEERDWQFLIFDA